MTSKEKQIFKVLTEKYHTISLTHIEEQARRVSLIPEIAINVLEKAYKEGKVCKLKFNSDVLFYLTPKGGKK